MGFIAPLCALAAADPVGFSSVLTERVIALFLICAQISFLSIIFLFVYYIRECNKIIEQVISYNIHKDPKGPWMKISIGSEGVQTEMVWSDKEEERSIRNGRSL
jgi:hypothetical protein